MFNNLQSENINELFGALSKAQGEMTAATKRNVNPFYKSKYADLSCVREAYQDALTKYGLCLMQSQTMNDQGKLFLITTLGHSSGQWIKSILPIVVSPDGSRKGNPLHELGSAITYIRRYAITSLLGIASEDEDDGNALSSTITHINKNIEPESAEERKINEKQIKGIVKMLADDLKAKEDMMIYLNKNGISKYEDITVSMYPKIINAIVLRKVEDATPANVEAGT